MKYKDFKKMTSEEMKEVKGGMESSLPGQLIHCPYPYQSTICIASYANPADCCAEWTPGGSCQENNSQC